MRDEDGRGSAGGGARATFLEMLAKFSKAANDQQLLLRWGWIEFFVFEDPCVAVGDEDGVQAGGESRVDVRFGAVANHPGRVRRESVLG